MYINQINAAILSGEFTDSELTSIYDAVKMAKDRLARLSKYNFSAGSKVTFTNPRNGYKYIGEVVKVKQKMISVRAEGLLWNVPANMLSAA